MRWLSFCTDNGFIKSILQCSKFTFPPLVTYFCCLWLKWESLPMKQNSEGVAVEQAYKICLGSFTGGKWEGLGESYTVCLYVKPVWYAGQRWSVDLMKAAIFLQHVTLMTWSWESLVVHVATGLAAVIVLYIFNIHISNKKSFFFMTLSCPSTNCQKEHTVHGS